MRVGTPGGLHWIRKSGDLKTIRRSGRLIRGELVNVWVSNPGCIGIDGGPAVGVVTGRGFRKAVNRNRARRRARGCIMEVRDILDPGGAYLVECRAGSEKVNYQILVNNLRDILTEAGNCKKTRRRPSQEE